MGLEKTVKGHKSRIEESFPDLPLPVEPFYTILMTMFSGNLKMVRDHRKLAASAIGLDYSTHSVGYEKDLAIYTLASTFIKSKWWKERKLKNYMAIAFEANKNFSNFEKQQEKTHAIYTWATAILHGNEEKLRKCQKMGREAASDDYQATAYYTVAAALLGGDEKLFEKCVNIGGVLANNQSNVVQAIYTITAALLKGDRPYARICADVGGKIDDMSMSDGPLYSIAVAYGV
jgi:hypothetical protein